MNIIVFRPCGVLRPAAATGAAVLAASLLLAGCNTVVATPPGAAPVTGSSEPLTIEHTSLRSRSAVYESALKACRQRGYGQAVFQSQVNEEPQRPPATGPQLSTFQCR